MHSSLLRNSRFACRCLPRFFIDLEQNFINKAGLFKPLNNNKKPLNSHDHPRCSRIMKCDYSDEGANHQMDY